MIDGNGSGGRNGGGNGSGPARGLVETAVPIVGRTKIYICPRGHVDELPGMFAMLFPADPRRPATDADAAKVCRMCLLDFMRGSFPVRLATNQTNRQAAADEAAAWCEELDGAADQILHEAMDGGSRIG